ncbi:S24 family peptidase [Chelatococcus sp.]|nr:S24 family peptidase [Chelatococcus sp.]
MLGGNHEATMRDINRICQRDNDRSAFLLGAGKFPCMENDVRSRIQRRLDKLGISMRAASLKAGMSTDAIRDLFRKDSMSPSLRTIERLAVALETSAEWLAFGSGDEDDPGPGARPVPTPRFQQIVVAGPVQAGWFREIDEFSQEEPETLYDEPDPEFPQARLVAFAVHGDSMNAASPPIPDGSRVICVDFEDTGLTIADGMIVVVERTKEDGSLREWSVKEVEFFPDRVEYRPRSTNPKHKPIVVSNDPDADDGSVRILALVRRVTMPVPRARITSR